MIDRHCTLLGATILFITVQQKRLTREVRVAHVVRLLTSNQCGSSSNPGVDAISGLSLLFVLFSVPRGLPPSSPDFPSPQKPAFLNFLSTRNGR